MSPRHALAGALAVCLGLFTSSSEARAECDPAPLAVQVLGAGGAVPDDGRAGPGYVVWIDGRARILIDAGAGAYLRFGQANARGEDVDLVALTRLRVEHVSDLPALLEAASVSGRGRPLAVSGPSGDRSFGGLRGHLRALFDRRRGAFPYLAGFLDGRDGRFRLGVTEVDVRAKAPTVVLESGDLRVTALSSHGGQAPALAYQVRTDRFRVVFAADAGSEDPVFLAWAGGADVLVVPYGAEGGRDRPGADAAPLPERLGALAAALRVRYLVLSRLPSSVPEGVEAVSRTIVASWDGTVLWADDLKCFQFREDLPPPPTDAPPAELPPGAGPPDDDAPDDDAP